MSPDNLNNQVLQDCVDELFALQEKMQEEQKSFVLQSSTLIKASHSQLERAVDLLSRTTMLAKRSEEAAREAAENAAAYQEDARFYKRFFFSWGAAFLISGCVAFGLLGLLGHRLAQRQQALANLEQTISAEQAKKLNTSHHHRGKREETTDE